MSYPKGPETKDDDDEVDDVSQEHQSVNICGRPILSPDNISKETLSRPLHTLEAAKKLSKR